MKKQQKATYLGLSTINYQQSGYTVYAVGHSKEAVERVASDEIGKDQYKSTLQTNLIVVSKTYAKRKYDIDLDAIGPSGFVESGYIDLRGLSGL